MDTLTPNSREENRHSFMIKSILKLDKKVVRRLKRSQTEIVKANSRVKFSNKIKIHEYHLNDFAKIASPINKAPPKMSGSCACEIF